MTALESIARDVVEGRDLVASTARLRKLLGEIRAERAEHAAVIERARELRATDELEIDVEPVLSLCEPDAGGHWVSAWVWVPNPEQEES